MRHALSTALQEFAGAMIIVSHDRHLLRTITDQFLLVANGGITTFDGDLDDYADWVKAQARGIKNDESNKDPAPRKDRKQLDAKNRQKLKPLRIALKNAEKTLDNLYIKQHQLEELLANNDLYTPEKKSELAITLEKQNALDEEITTVEEQWLEAQQVLEAKS